MDKNIKTIQDTLKKLYEAASERKDILYDSLKNAGDDEDTVKALVNLGIAMGVMNATTEISKLINELTDENEHNKECEYCCKCKGKGTCVNMTKGEGKTKYCYKDMKKFMDKEMMRVKNNFEATYGPGAIPMFAKMMAEAEED